jgi:hypothetical protein
MPYRVRFIFVGRLFSHDVARASSPCKHGQDGRATFFTYKREAHPAIPMKSEKSKTIFPTIISLTKA